jgi:hypothetical protein
MSDPMTMKWAIVDLLKICDVAHEGRLHGDLARIARTLGVELTSPVINPQVVAMVEAEFSQAGRGDGEHLGDDITSQLNFSELKKYGKKPQDKN